MKYKSIIGLEIHVELATETKAFCSCKNEFGAEPNTRTCPVCLALPGAMPVLNKKVLEYSVMAGLAFSSKINNISRFMRKNYFYPDLTKGFQISQTDKAICKGGHISIDTDDGPKDIRLIQVQMEEDTGKSMHMDEDTLLNYNRAGVPLIEIVTEPDLSSGKEARAFLEKLKATLKYLGISDCRMEEGSLRCDVNVNVKDLETGERTAITEVKNLNSFRGVEKAIDYEINRQIDLLKNNKKELRTTRRWDDQKEETLIMRIKYTESDYRFAPEGDLPPVMISNSEIEAIKNKMPELPWEKKIRFKNIYGLSDYDASVLTSTKDFADYFEDLAKNFKDYNLLSNWLLGEVLRRAEKDEDQNPILDFKFEKEALLNLLKMISDKKISIGTGKNVFRKMFEEGKDPIAIVEEEGLIQVSDQDEIEKIVDQVLAENPSSIEDFKNGKTRVLGFLVGLVMKSSKGKANPQIANELITEKLKNF
ncbi:aspartyl/glutamyl-tRNA(Asn/Gln) amidotransferase, B subunit [Clostridiales bacterium KA00134]|nr:aspartyl/glutamyl-tRNA(Asn/Gln) amidotransferase, B subunit [Clostridiales bacterium KA00134]